MILFLDTSSYLRIVSVLDSSKEILRKVEKNDLELSSRMLPMIEETLKEAKVEPKEISKIYVVTGPGSFTGIRVGVTIAKTWAWTLKKQIIPLSELELFATTHLDADYIIPYIDARRDYAYSAIYDQKGYAILKDCHIKREELLNKIPKDKKVVFVSFDDIDVPFEVVEPKIDVEKLIKRHIDEVGVNPHECNPNYLKKTEAEENLERSKKNDKNGD